MRVSENQEIDQDDIPRCTCDIPGIVRPNIVLFQDTEWNSERADEQEIEYKTFMEYVQDDKHKMVILELGIDPVENSFLSDFAKSYMDHDQITYFTKLHLIF